MKQLEMKKLLMKKLVMKKLELKKLKVKELPACKAVILPERQLSCKFFLWFAGFCLDRRVICSLLVADVGNLATFGMEAGIFSHSFNTQGLEERIKILPMPPLAPAFGLCSQLPLIHWTGFGMPESEIQGVWLKVIPPLPRLLNGSKLPECT